MLRRASTAASASSKGRSSLRTSTRSGSGSSTRTPRRSRSTRSTAGFDLQWLYVRKTVGGRDGGAARAALPPDRLGAGHDLPRGASRRASRPVLPDQGARGPRALPSEAPRDAVGVGARLGSTRRARAAPGAEQLGLQELREPIPVPVGRPAELGDQRFTLPDAGHLLMVENPGRSPTPRGVFGRHAIG